MKEPRIPVDEIQRLETLRALRILESAPEERFDRLTRMAKRIFGVPISLVTLVDSERQWFKSKQGLEASETPRSISFCGHAILGEDIFIVPNALEDERFHDNPLVTEAPYIRFYAGHPLKASNGHKMGTLCLIDEKPRELEEEDKELLSDLAVMVEQEIAALQLATLDELTMISNRRGFMLLAQHALNLCHRHERSATLIFFDLNKFKPINDTFGHAEGDWALLAFANLLRQEFRDSDVFARLGGDEFVVLLTGTSEDEIDPVLERFEKALSDYNETAKRGYDLECSAGHVTKAPSEKYSIADLLERADQKMYHSKQASQNSE